MCTFDIEWAECKFKVVCCNKNYFLPLLNEGISKKVFVFELQSQIVILCENQQVKSGTFQQIYSL